MKKYEWIISIINFIINFMLLIVLILLTFNICEFEEKNIGEIDNKFEVNGKCYLEVGIEVTPEEYIGYDIGDDYIYNPGRVIHD